MTDYGALTPVNIVTGFLGSGKTTLLQRLLRAPELKDVAVLVNEFGEVGLDHHLLQGVAESTLLLENGCLCCAVRGDLQKALRDLLSRRTRGDIPSFRRVVIETSGLADPVPIAYTLLSEAVLRHHFRLSGIVATVDAVNGAAQLKGYPEAVKQASVADRLIVTKVDLSEAETVAALRARLRALNVSAEILDSGRIEGDVHRLLTDDIYDAQGKFRETGHWAAGEADAADHDHADGVQSFAVTFDRPLDWTAFGVWASMLLHRHGADVLRLKGLLNVAGVPTPVLINGVQHIVHPPSHLEAWPDADRRSRLIFIVRGLQRARIERSLAVFNGLVNRPAVVPA
ncbi:MAG TPA: GTP-binding protein [Stellaceae bacterium]|nr:GTP-binding protein [Stellaceae bacterium]